MDASAFALKQCCMAPRRRAGATSFAQERSGKRIVAHNLAQSMKPLSEPGHPKECLGAVVARFCMPCVGHQRKRHAPRYEVANREMCDNDWAD